MLTMSACLSETVETPGVLATRNLCTWLNGADRRWKGWTETQEENKVGEEIKHSDSCVFI